MQADSPKRRAAELQALCLGMLPRPAWCSACIPGHQERGGWGVVWGGWPVMRGSRKQDVGRYRTDGG